MTEPDQPPATGTDAPNRPDRTRPTPITRWQHLLWQRDPASMPKPLAGVVWLLRLLQAMARDLAEGQLTLRAMSLVYTTLLSLVPLLAVSFSVLKAFGVHNQIEPMLHRLVLPLGEKGSELVTRIIGFVDNVNAGALGGVGLVVLLYTVVSLLQKIESAFNFVWGVKRSRRLARRFSDYLSVLMIGPVLVFAALGVTASALNSKLVNDISQVAPVGLLVVEFSKLLPYMIMIGAFTFLYIFITNTRVRLLPALAGGTFAGILWETLGYGFALFVKNAGNTQAIYSSFAILVLLLIWLYLSWLTLLLGAQLAFYVQNPHSMRYGRSHWRLSNRDHELAGLAILQAITEAFLARQAPPDSTAMANRLRLPETKVTEIAEGLEQAGYLRLASGESSAAPAWVPATPPAAIPLADVLRSLRTLHGHNLHLPLGNERLRSLTQRLEAAQEQALADLTLADLADLADRADLATTDAARPAEN